MKRWLACVALTACAHELGPSEINRLTTCHDTDLKAIRKSLLLNDYEVKSETDTDLTTGWKQIAGYGRDRTLQRITVVKLDDRTYRFRVRLRYYRLERDEDRAGVMGPYHRRHGVVFDFSQPMELVSEEDPPYTQEEADQYAGTQREVCGTNPEKDSGKPGS